MGYKSLSGGVNAAITIKMCSAFLIVLLCFGIASAGDPGVISNEECFSVGAKRVHEIVSHSKDKDFQKDVDKFSGSHFLTTARYCLGPDGSESSQNFIACILSLTTCPIRGNDIVNWDLCTCDALHCILKSCVQKWIEQMSMKDLSCVVACLYRSSACILNQTGSIGKSPTTLASGQMYN